MERLDRIINWAFDTIAKSPPIPLPSLLAVIIVLLLVFPLVRKALRSPAPDPVDHDATNSVTLNAGGIYTILVDVQIEVAKLRKEIGNLTGKTLVLTDKVNVIDKMLRRRSGRSKKLTAPAEDEPESM